MIKLFIIFIFISSCISKKYISTIYIPYFGGYEVMITMGGDQRIIVNPNIIYDYSVLSSFNYQKDNLTDYISLGSFEETIKNKTSTFEYLKGTIQIDNINISNFNFLYKRKDPSFKDHFGLAHTYTNIDYSLIHLLKSNNLIDELSFGFSPKNINESGTFYLGGIEEEIENKYFNSKCKVKDNSKFWGCKLQSVYINNDTRNQYIINEMSYFLTHVYDIYVPKIFYDYLYHSFFQHYVDENVCKFTNQIGKQILNCNCSIINQTFPNVTFVIDDTHFTFTKTELFDVHQDKCDFLLYPNENNSWIIGTQFFIKYYIKFSYDDNSITFYQTYPFLNSKINNITEATKKLFILCIDCIEIIFIIALYYVKRKYLSN